MTSRTISLQDKKQIVIDFLLKCNVYSDQMLDKYTEQSSQSDSKDQAAIQQKIHDWTSYHDFNAYAIEELTGEELDDWF
ncbi:MAG: hypothetical protein KBT50_00265 [Cycloclasticus sp.]|nr:hypothetical protein [Cycloclasticus sp.]MBQ0789023.1 hypothetical protein [Cycloclasticus sp.]